MVTFSDDNWDEGFDVEAEDSQEMDEFAPADPFEDLSSRDQDLFFRIVDMLPDDKREATMAYMMDNPRVIKAVIESAKTKRELIKNNDVEGMKALLAQENVVLEKIDANAAENGDFEYPLAE